MKRCWFLIVFFVSQSYAQRADFNHIDFSTADSVAMSYKNEKLDNLAVLSHKLTSSLGTDVERFRSIYTWVCNNIENDYGQYLKNQRKRNRFKDDPEKLDVWNERFNQDVFNKLLKNNRTVCTGYAYLLKELANLSNLDCEIVHGFSRTSTTNIEKLDIPNHSWNAIKLNGKWYLCDPTWSSGIQNPETFAFIFDYNDGYFLPNPELFAINHYPIDPKWSLLDEMAPTFNDFLEAPIIYGNAYKNLETHKAPKMFHNVIKKHETVTFTYQLQKQVAEKSVSLLIDSGSSNRKIKPKNITITDRNLTMEHQFNNTGFFDVHLKIGEDYISTYTFEVE